LSQTLPFTHRFPVPVWYAELDIAKLLCVEKKQKKVGAPSVFPPVKRDLSVLVDNSTPYEVIQASMLQEAGDLAAGIELIDRYTGKQVPQGKYSLTFSIEYRDLERTLTASEVETRHQHIIQTLQEKFNTKLR